MCEIIYYESCLYSEQLAQGNLKAKTSRPNIFAMPLKGLQANWAHLTWQADQVAKVSAAVTRSSQIEKE